MSEELWNKVDERLVKVLPADPALREALAESERAGLPNVQVSRLQGMFLHILALASGARRVLEVGTLGGYSTIWLGRALPEGGRLLSLELEPKHAEIARANLERTGLKDRVEVRVGPALASLSRLEAEGAGPFDLTFIDADKPNNLAYFEAALRLSRPGSLIVVDNMVRRGEILDAESTDPRVVGSRQLLKHLENEPRVVATVIQTVGEKGHDGFALARVLGAPPAP